MTDVAVLNVLLYSAPIGTLTRVASDRTLHGHDRHENALRFWRSGRLVRRVPRHVPVPRHDGGSRRATVQGRHEPYDQLATTVWGLQFDEGERGARKNLSGSWYEKVCDNKEHRHDNRQP